MDWSRSPQGPWISFHRGGSETAGSSTRAAYEAAISQGAEIVEFDVLAAKGGALICVHDAHLGDDRIADLTIEEIQARNPTLPTYREMLELANGVGCHIDLKAPGFERAAATVALEVLDDPSTIVFTTIYESSIRILRAEFPDLLAALTIGRSVKQLPPFGKIRSAFGDIFPGYRVRRCDANAITTNHRYLRLPFVRRVARRHNLPLFAWTVNQDRRLRKMLRSPTVSVVVTDRPLAAARIRDELNV